MTASKKKQQKKKASVDTGVKKLANLQVSDEKKSQKSGKIALQQRVDTVLSLLIGGCRTAEILRYAAEKTDWNVAPRTVESYITKANQQFPRISKFKKDMELGKAIARLNSLYRKSTAAGDHRTALLVQKGINELLGLNAPTRLAHEGKDGTPLIPEVTDDKLHEIAKDIVRLSQKPPD